MHSSAFALALALFAALAHGQRLQIYQASVPGPISGWSAGPVLPPKITLCANDLPSPFTVVCIPDEGMSASSAKFYLNGVVVRAERQLPYVITGDMSSKGAFPWNNPPTVSEITCVLSGGQTVTSTILFSCDDDTETPTTDAPPTTMPPTTMPAAPPAAAAPRSSGTSACVYIPATGYESKTGAWMEGGGGMEYKFSDSTTKVDRAGLATMTYSFVAPLTARYGVTVDMLTSHGTEHNDIWLEVDGVPFTLVKKGSSQDGKSGMNKAYHNNNGRSKLVYTVDFNAHVFSTKPALEAGASYVVNIGGRSTKIRVYAIILFPCDAFGCAPGNQWNSAVNTCSA
ncbi:unnamed protein product [Agarophyton chilense]